jgi:hypothetical protein
LSDWRSRCLEIGLEIAVVTLQCVVIRTFGRVRSLPFVQGACGASLRLKHECALSNARIAAALGIAKGSVANYLAAATDTPGSRHCLTTGL